MTQMVEPREKIKTGTGFIAALDQSGGSTPKALALYGIGADTYQGEAEMFAQMHAMRARIIKAPAFASSKVIGTILFERTMRETINNVPVPELLWGQLGIVPFLKIDKGLAEQANGVQLMNPMPDLANQLAEAKQHGIVGTKERSVIHEANKAGIEQIVAQQFDVARMVLDAGLVPIIEPEVSISAPDKAEAEIILHDMLMTQVHALPACDAVMLKLTIPERAGLYDDLAACSQVLRVVALSGGYSTDVACQKLSHNSQMIASFSRALTEGLQAQMSAEEFNARIADNIEKIYAAST